jgi:lambda family phage tail tape measure protein
VESIAKLLGGFAGGGFVGGAAAAKSPGQVNAGIAGGVRGLPGHATGGYTGHGGKYEPAGIVHKGEFVFTKEATRKIGVPRLYSLMRQPRPVASWGDVRPVMAPRMIRRPDNGYAAGGLVTAPAAQSVNLSGSLSGTLHLEVDQGVIVRAASAYIESPTGQKQALRVLRRNKGAAGGILGG